ncbi:nuclear transport factor 2 family protein [Vibrio sp. JC009]|uniref:nuclear transport factor 2 family protein n=1 Tax=Vibrio sp. JC009 TaxID=2912314 RepID=UPI0023AFFB9D|nr:nuclear transport factor 2 family protein [Vibrio sp. JC009]WED23018.1 nuclear transport factor 2 family protein [Vibrio sp. JC009]
MFRKLMVIFLGFMAMTTQAYELTKDEAQIALTVQSMGTLADRNQYDVLEKIFTPEVVVDYTSAFGGEVSTIQRSVLMTNWAGLLPGFDATYHDLNNIKVVEQKGNKAKATADIVASHYIGEEGYWQISGSYSYELEKTGDTWQISSLTLHAGEEQGTRDVLGLAIEAAKKKN